MRIRAYDPERDLPLLRRCVVELQELERSFDPRLPGGAEMVDPYCELLLERCRAWQGVLLVSEEEDGRASGLVSIFLRVPGTEPDEPAGHHALISDLVVLPGHRGRGTGAALLARAEAHARSAGAAVLRLEVMADNHSARGFYREHGWRERLVQLEKPLPDPPPARP